MPEDTWELVHSLNKLLENVEIPVEIETPSDLTPTLLLAILESTLQSRLPLQPKVRQARTPQAKIEAVKILLGVLGGDILGIDLSDIEPRRLARGEWAEVVYIGGLLIHVARKFGMMPDDLVIDVDPDVSFTEAFNATIPPPSYHNQHEVSQPRGQQRSPAQQSLDPATDVEVSNLTHRLPSDTKKHSIHLPPLPTQNSVVNSIDQSVCSCAVDGNDITGMTTSVCDCTTQQIRYDGWIVHKEDDFDAFDKWREVRRHQRPENMESGRNLHSIEDCNNTFSLLSQKARLLDELADLSLLSDDY